MARHRLASEHLHDIEAARDRVLTVARPDREERMIQLLVQIVGLGVETATVLVREMLCRPFRDRRAVASYAGLTGTPFRSGGIDLPRHRSTIWIDPCHPSPTKSRAKIWKAYSKLAGRIIRPYSHDD